MIFRKNYSLLFFVFALSIICQPVLPQDSLPTFVAKEGDGIISVLRREGLEIKTYYQKFIELNNDQIADGSLLKLGKTYKIPNSEYSYRNIGKIINLSDTTERPIFDVVSSTLSKKDSTLKNTVYYLLLDTFKNDDFQVLTTNTTVRKEFAVSMAKELMQQGARVFLFEYNAGQNPKLSDYIDAVNKRFLKYRGEYQRLLVLDVDSDNFSKDATILVSHHLKSQEGERFANSIENIFKEKKIKLKSPRDKNIFFAEKANYFIANNTMPAMIFIKVDNNTKIKKSAALANVEKNNFIDFITTGIKVDYSTISIED